MRNDTYKAMMWAGDTQLGRVVQALKQRGMWGDTLLFYVSDNGGVEDGVSPRRPVPAPGQSRCTPRAGMPPREALPAPLSAPRHSSTTPSAARSTATGRVGWPSPPS